MANGAYVSPYRSPHQSFPQPDTGSVKVWRYLSLPKLISLLHSQCLHFIRADQLRDDFEGSVTRGVQEKWRKVERMSLLRLEMKRQVYVSCWHENNADSEAMWRLYCGEADGVALKTSYETLDRSLPTGVFLGRVKYLDYGNDGPSWDDDNTLTAFMHKRSAFQHEREIRAVLLPPSHFVALGLSPDRFPPYDGPVFPIEWDVVGTVESVFVNPYAPQWYYDVVQVVLQKLCEPLLARLVWSPMKGVPIY